VQPSDGVTSMDNGAARRVGPGRLQPRILPGGERALPLRRISRLISSSGVAPDSHTGRSRVPADPVAIAVCVLPWREDEG